MGAGDAVDWVVVSQRRVLRHDIVDRPFVVGDGQIDQDDVPGPQVLVKGGGAREHPGHVGHRRDIPVVQGLVEGVGAAEHPGHVSHRRDIPGGDVTVEGGCIPEHVGHVGDAREIWCVGRPVDHVGGVAEGPPHGSPRHIAPLVYRHEPVRIRVTIQRDGLKAAVDQDSVGAGIHISVGYGSGDIGAAGAITPVDGHAGSHKGDGDGLAGGIGLPDGYERELVWRLLRMGHPERSRKGGITDPVCTAVSVSKEKDQGRRHYE